MSHPGCPHNCRQGWLTGADSDQPTPCPHCKCHLYKAHNKFSEVHRLASELDTNDRP